MDIRAKVAMLLVAGIVGSVTGARADDTKKSSELGHMEGMRDMHLFQVEPSIINEDYYTKGKAERHQFVGQILPAGSPIPDTQGPMPLYGDASKPAAAAAAAQPATGTTKAPVTVAPPAKVTQ